MVDAWAVRLQPGLEAMPKIKIALLICFLTSTGLLSALTNAAQSAGKPTVLNFPNQPVGRYYLIKAAADPEHDGAFSRIMAAVGAVTVPAGYGIDLTLNYNGSQNTKFLRSLPSGIIRKLTCRDLEITDEAVEDFCSQKGLVLLNLQGADITDNGIKHLSSMKGLRKLSLSDTLITVKGLSVLSSLPNLENLNLSRMALGDTVSTPLQALKNLYILDLTGTQLTDKAVINLPAFPNLCSLILRRNNLTDKCIDSIRRYRNLQVIDLTDTHVTGEGLKRLKGLPHLHTVIFRTDGLKPGDRMQLKKLMPVLRIEDGSREKFVPREIFAPLH